MVIQKIGLVYHPLNKAAYILSEELATFLGKRSVEYWMASAFKVDDIKQHLSGTNLILTTGGDGTILRTAQAVIGTEIPITGINLGKLGFLTELEATDIFNKLPAILNGGEWYDKRTLLKAELKNKSNSSPKCFTALNDVVVARGSIARVIDITIKIDNHTYKTLTADGVIIATATGSTGYSLSAGGPVLYQQSKDLLLTPILPHPGPAYSLVLPPDSATELEVGINHEAMLCLDGHINNPLTDGDIIKIRRSPMVLTFLRLKNKQTYYETLERKLARNKSIIRS
jgi:NAD+ kinase